MLTTGGASHCAGMKPSDLPERRALTTVRPRRRRPRATVHLNRFGDHFYALVISDTGISCLRASTLENLLMDLASIFAGWREDGEIRLSKMGRKLEKVNDFVMSFNAMFAPTIMWETHVSLRIEPHTSWRAQRDVVAHAYRNMFFPVPLICSSRPATKSDPLRERSAACPVVIAADGSWTPGQSGYAAAVDHQGNHQVIVTNGGSRTEVEAIHLAITMHRDSGRKTKWRPLIVLSDCETAIKDVAENYTFTKNVTLVHVFSHAGHPLHDAADRIATYARRCAPGDPNPDTVDRILSEATQQMGDFNPRQPLNVAGYDPAGRAPWSRSIDWHS